MTKNFQRMKKTVLLIFLIFLTNCKDTSQSADSQSVLDYLNGIIGNVEICLKDQEFRFPDVIVAPKYNGKGLAQLDALVIAGLLHETEETVSDADIAPKYIYHYKRHHQMERKTFYLTDLGLKFYRTNKNVGYFCYGRPEEIKIEQLNPAKNGQGELILNTTFSYHININPEATWISNSWIQREFPQVNQVSKRQTARQQFIKINNNSIKPVPSGIVNNRYW